MNLKWKMEYIYRLSASASAKDISIGKFAKNSKFMPGSYKYDFK